MLFDTPLSHFAPHSRCQQSLPQLSHPLAHPHAHRSRHPLHHSPRAPRTLAPSARLVEGADGDYEAQLELDGCSRSGHKLLDLSAEINQRTRCLTISGLVDQLDRTSDFVVRERAGLYSAPSRSQRFAILSAGTRVRGEECPHNPGWIELEEGYVPAFALYRISQPQRTRHPFKKELALPGDADINGATVTSPAGSNSLTVHIPRLRASTSQVRNLANERLGRPLDTSGARASAKEKPRPQAKNVSETPPSPTDKAAPHSSPKDTPGASQEGSKRKCSPHRMSSVNGALPLSDPVLMECEVSQANVQQPSESTEEWTALPLGGFQHMSW